MSSGALREGGGFTSGFHEQHEAGCQLSSYPGT